MKIKKSDNVLIITGKDKGRKGKVLKAFPREGRIIIEGINIRKKHVKPKRSGEKGQIVQVPLAIDVSNVKLLCPKCGKAARVGYKLTEDKKQRICKKCGEKI